jgi:IrrE N-terminal-like domain
MTLLNPYFINLSENPRAGAQQILKDGGIDAIPVDLISLLRRHDWSLTFEDFGDPEWDRRDGRFEQDADNQISIFINTDDRDEKGRFSTDPVTYRRQRFSIAHEIGHAHFLSHKDKDLQDSLNPKINPHGRSYGNKRESQANEFAAELLMPQWQLEVQLRSFFWEEYFKGIEDLAELYETSFLSCAMRVAREAMFPAMCMYFNSAARLAQVPARSRFHADTGFFFPTKDPIPKRTLADDLANKPDYEGWKRKQSDCTYWFPTEKKAKDYELIEQAKRVGKFGYLVFLSFIEKEKEY